MGENSIRLRLLMTTPPACYWELNIPAYCLKDVKRTHIEWLEFVSTSGS